MISGILLAAGESKRMGGSFKPLLKWGRRTVIGECVYNLRQSQLTELIVVLGHREAEIRPRLLGSGVAYAINPDYRAGGMLSSIKTGIAQVSPQMKAMLIALVDQPMVTTTIINQLINAYEAGGKKIAVPVYQGRHGHPVILSTEYIDDILQINDASDEGLRAFINSHRDEILEVPVDSASVLEDIDRPEDYERLSREARPLYAYNRWHP